MDGFKGRWGFLFSRCSVEGLRRIWGGVLEGVEIRWREIHLDDTVGLEYQPAKSLV